MKKNESYFLKLIKPKGRRYATLYGEQSPLHLDLQLEQILDAHGIRYKRDTLQHDKHVPCHTVLCTPRINNSMIVVVQTLDAYDHYIQSFKREDITLICFNRRKACFFNYKLSTEHPFFLFEETSIPHDDLEWGDWFKKIE